MNFSGIQFIDSHSHLADPRLDSPDDELRRQLLREAAKLGVTSHLQGGVGPEDWDRQTELAKKYSDIWPVFGLHPYWVADHTDSECEEALDLLAKILPKALALGETGLDFRPHIAKDSTDRQITCFEQQLELATLIQKPVVLHLVQCHEEALKVLDMWGVPRKGAIVHSFNGTAVQAQDFLERGLFLSVGGPVARKSNQRLHQALKEIPIERLLVETDSPDQPGDRLRGQLNRPASLMEVAEVIGDIKQKSSTEILQSSRDNLLRILYT